MVQDAYFEYFQYLEPFRSTSRVWQTDRRIDRTNCNSIEAIAPLVAICFEEPAVLSLSIGLHLENLWDYYFCFKTKMVSVSIRLSQFAPNKSKTIQKLNSTAVYRDQDM